MGRLKQFWNWFLGLFSEKWKLTVSYNSTYGDADDSVYIVKKFYTKKDKYLKFLTEDKEVVEIRGAEGLNYKIEQL